LHSREGRAAEDLAPRMLELNTQLHRPRATIEEIEGRIVQGSVSEFSDDLPAHIRARIE